MNIPKQLFVGDSESWDDDATTDNLGDPIDSGDWTLKYVISGTSALTLTAVAEGSGWRTTMTKTNSQVLGAGEFYWQAYAEYSTRRVTLGTGRITMKAAAGSGVSGKSQAQEDLDAVNSAIRSMISGGAVAEYTVGNRSLRKMPMADLLTLKSHLESEVRKEEKAENIANGLGNPSNVFVRFR